MNYREWELTVPVEIKGDSVWKSEAYRLALFAADLAWRDAARLLSDKRTISLADQLYRKERHVLDREVVSHRMCLLTHIIKLLLTMIPDQRGQLLREDAPTYDSPPAVFEFVSPEQLDKLLQSVPAP